MISEVINEFKEVTSRLIKWLKNVSTEFIVHIDANCEDVFIDKPKLPEEIEYFVVYVIQFLLGIRLVDKDVAKCLQIEKLPENKKKIIIKC